MVEYKVYDQDQIECAIIGHNYFKVSKGPNGKPIIGGPIIICIDCGFTPEFEVTGNLAEYEWRRDG